MYIIFDDSHRDKITRFITELENNREYLLHFVDPQTKINEIFSNIRVPVNIEVSEIAIEDLEHTIPQQEITECMTKANLDLATTIALFDEGTYVDVDFDCNS